MSLLSMICPGTALPDIRLQEYSVIGYFDHKIGYFDHKFSYFFKCCITQKQPNFLVICIYFYN